MSRILKIKDRNGHNRLASACGLIEYLKNLDSVFSVGIGRFTLSKKSVERTVDIKGYDENRQSYLIDYVTEEGTQKVFVKHRMGRERECYSGIISYR